MKKLLLILSSGTVLFLSSCASKSEAGAGGMSEQARKNLETNRAISKMFETKDFSKATDYFAADAVDYAGMNGPVKGPDSIKASLENMAAMMTDTKHEVVRELADDEYVMSWMKFSGTCNVDAPEMGMIKGQKINTEAIEVSQYNKEGKAIAHWTFMQPSELMKMMPQQGPPMVDPNATQPKKDTISK
jgi:ketosteroid isomerase-like protein